ncbi:GNAT family N-acetyltransferase [Aurantimonas sp. HBX-1]|uniref:GNAT family N-acetyltransferase n=1 Tax=Aurantimonas sp. HBX-1 TaxID=2906072 RepID=UPI00351CDF0B
MLLNDAIASDVPELVALVNSAYRSPGAVAGWTDERGLLEGPRADRQAILTALDHGRMRVLRPSSGGAPVACVHIALDEDLGWYLSLLAVDPDQQGKGVGGALLEEVARQAIEAGILRLRITVIKQRRDLIAWYEARGFRSTGETVPFPCDDPSRRASPAQRSRIDRPGTSPGSLRHSNRDISEEVRGRVGLAPVG